jgi:putative oxidoreductase
MERVLGRYSSYVYAILRIVMGFLFLQHGTQKFFAWPPPAQPGGGGPLEGLSLVAAILELVCGVLIMVGFFTSFAAFIASGLMAVAYFMVHQPMGALPISNRGELAVVYCFIFLYIAARGSGIWSVDSIARGSRSVSGG